mmetsp:Transcript_19536/g.59107  ORF Transcript_19536/g.59107 Transcript_19536/m.59107 type:complete len:249 (-) Transcript_19536:1477-2223(-)
MNLLVLRFGEYSTEVIEETLPRVVRREHFNKFICAELLRVLASHLHNGLQILTHVGTQQVIEALDGVFDREGSKKLDEELGWNELSAQHRPLHVVHILVVLQSTRGESSLLTKHGDPRAVVVVEHLVRHDGVRHLRRCHQIHLKQSCLQVGLLGLVALKRIQEERGSLLKAVVLHEDIGDDAIVESDAIGRSKLLGEVERTLGVDAHDVCEQQSPVSIVVHFLTVDHDLVELAGLDKALDNLGISGRP